MLSSLHIKQIEWIKKKSKGLIKGCTSKVNKVGWQSDKLFVAISLGKRISYCRDYEKLSGKLFAEFIENKFTDFQNQL